MEEQRTMDELLTALTKIRAELKTLQTEEKGLKGQKMDLEARIAYTLEQQGIDRNLSQITHNWAEIFNKSIFSQR